MGALVLVVDDFIDALDLYRCILGIGGFDVITAAGGTQAIELAKSRRPQLILMDLLMPGMDGVTASRIIKADRHCARVPIVACTAYPESISPERPDLFAATLPKPCQPEVLLATLRAILAASQVAS
jgi:CheY-like chemotaxis protein